MVRRVASMAVLALVMSCGTQGTTGGHDAAGVDGGGCGCSGSGGAITVTYDEQGIKP